ncbi:MAG: DUF3592 domain-containing protein [Candidatus Omnitrophica bacterium]|nr:DUF3592 domain-containing protein [Candidatus Omnitrophota bacterium]MCB9747554.1 DUF3592 domain-containing protein [Candidatus Omnitrophota bacterium]
MGGFLSYIGLDLIKDTLDIRQWPKTTAVIVDKKYDTIDGMIDYYLPYVYYQYQLNGQHYTSDRIFLDQGDSFSRIKIERMLEEYPIGREVSVFYNPTNPAIAMLQVGLKPFYIIVTTVGCVFIFSSIWIFGKAGRRAKN